MKAIVLAGGRGTRLRPLTHTTNKHLIPIGGKPMIERVIEDIAESGITDIIVNLNKDDTEIPAALGDGSRWGVKLHFIEQPEPNGMMYPILLAEEIIDGDDFILHAGDNILAGGLKKYVDELKSTECDALVLVTRIKHPERFSVYQVDGKRAISVVEKPTEPIGDLAGTAIYMYKGTAIFEAMKNVKPIVAGKGGIAEYYPPPAHQWMIDNGYTVNVTECTGWWKDTGKPEDLIAANHLALEVMETQITGIMDESNIEGRVSLGEGSTIENSIVRGPVFIGKNVKIKNAYVGPFTAISDNCVLEECEVENSIIMSGAKISNLNTRIDASLVGYNATVSTKNTKPRTLNLFIGDNSDVKLP
jgi:glucose-1-phosphate thymidylyltransferase